MSVRPPGARSRTGTRGSASPDWPPPLHCSTTQEPAPEQTWRDFPRLELAPPLAGALEAFVELGYHGASVRDIAQRAGLSVPGVYHHWPTKQHLLVALLELTMDDLLDRARAARA